MASLAKRLFRSRKQSRPLIVQQAKPGDGTDYRIPYKGERVFADYDFLKKCKTLDPHTGAYRLNETTVIKAGESVSMAEASAMRFVSERTSIAVPKVLDTYTRDANGRGVIVMGFVEGEMLDEYWAKASPEGKEVVLSREYIKMYLRERTGTLRG